MVQPPVLGKQEHSPGRGGGNRAMPFHHAYRGSPHFPCISGGCHHRLISGTPPASGKTLDVRLKVRDTLEEYPVATPTTFRQDRRGNEWPGRPRGDAGNGRPRRNSSRLAASLIFGVMPPSRRASVRLSASSGCRKAACVFICRVDVPLEPTRASTLCSTGTLDASPQPDSPYCSRSIMMR